jgi:hypothetical protein
MSLLIGTGNELYLAPGQSIRLFYWFADPTGVGARLAAIWQSQYAGSPSAPVSVTANGMWWRPGAPGGVTDGLPNDTLIYYADLRHDGSPYGQGASFRLLVGKLS